MAVHLPSADAPPPEDTAPSTHWSAGRAAAWLARTMEVAVGTAELTLPQYRTLGILAEGSSAASRLAERLAVRPSSITAVVDGLVARGLVERRPEEGDRRRVSLRLTPQGARTLARADQAADSCLEEIAGHLPDRDQATALGSLPLWGQAMTAARVAPREQSAVLTVEERR
jgi:long-chain acyl-CoA synthetase